MDKLIALLRTFGSIKLTPKGITLFDPTNVDMEELTALATPLGFEVRHQQPADGEQYYDKSSNSMVDSKHMLQVGKPTTVTDDDALQHLQQL